MANNKGIKINNPSTLHLQNKKLKHNNDKANMHKQVEIDSKQHDKHMTDQNHHMPLMTQFLICI